MSRPEEDKKKPSNRKSQEKPEYRIKKSSSVEKGLGNMVKKQGIASYDSAKGNNSNVNDYKSADSMRSPPQKRTREEVLRQLNQELKAEKKGDEQERKLSSKHMAAPSHHENASVRRNNYLASEEELAIFMAKPKLRRTPPKEDQ